VTPRSGWSRRLLLQAVAVPLLGPAIAAANSQATPEPPEVRQIVTFSFLPGRTEEAIRVYENDLRPIYAATPALRRFRGYREAESPEPLDLVVASSYGGMEGMDRANESLRRPLPSRPSALSLYGSLSAMTRTHHDQFVEIIAPLSDTATTETGLVVFEYLRIAPGAHGGFEGLLAEWVRGFERERHLADWSETGRMLVSDGWDYLRIFGIRSLADWHRYRTETREAAFAGKLQDIIAARKTMILRNLPSVAVR